MVMDQNPALPNMGSIIHKFKHHLNLDPALKKLVCADSVFVSHRNHQTIGGTISAVLVELQAVIGREKPLLVSFLNQLMQFCREADNAGCHACGKCYVCKQSFLSPCSKFRNHHSKQVFPITMYITCKSYNLIYLMECRTCKQSYVGYTTANLPKRFSNHKSHIKKGIRKLGVAS